MTVPPPEAMSEAGHDRRRRPARRACSGLRVLVTGASSGVGRAVAVELARRGARVLATARREGRLRELADGMRHGSDAAAHPLLCEPGDITDPAFRRRLVAAAADGLGGLDVVVAAAGSGAIGAFRDGSPATFARIIDVDFLAPAELVRSALPLLAASADPAVVFVGSILGCHPLPLHGEYCAAKAAVASLARTLRVELRRDGIDVLLASLGPTESEFWDSLLAGARPTWSRGRRMPADRAARAIVSGLERRRFEIVPGWQAKGFAFAARFFPGLIDAIASRNLRAGGRQASSRDAQP